MGDSNRKSIELNKLQDQTELTIKELDSALSKYVIFRVMSFLAIVAWVYFFFGGSWLMWIGVLVFTAMFFYLVKRHAVKFKQRAFQRNKQKVIALEMKAMVDDYSGFPNGNIYQDATHAFSADLDVFGENSIFIRMCRSVSLPAQKKIADRLVMPFMGAVNWEKQKNALVEWRGRLDLRMELFANTVSSGMNLSEIDALIDLATRPALMNSKVLKIYCIAIPLYSFAFLFSYLIDYISLTQFLFALAFPLATIGLNIKNIIAEYSTWSNFLGVIDSYEDQIQLILTQEWASEIAKANGKNLKGADFAFADLRKIISSFDQRNNKLLGIPLNVFLSWDFQQIRRINNWKRQHGQSMEEWIAALVDCEYLASLSSYLWINEDELVEAEYSSDSSMRFSMLNGIHPFMKKNTAVSNNIEFQDSDGMMIITGANMAGKSTFLRTIGANIILAFSLGFTHAEKLSFSDFILFSSMRTSDSIQKGQSYFFNELARLKLLVESKKEQSHMMVLLDEILKGTNSEDKARGSKLFVEKLLEEGIQGVIATHDLSLCELETLYPERIRNRSFEVEIGEDGLHFDYKLREGICHTMNASYLLKSMGLGPSKSMI